MPIPFTMYQLCLLGNPVLHAKRVDTAQGRAPMGYPSRVHQVRGQIFLGLTALTTARVVHLEGFGQ